MTARRPMTPARAERIMRQAFRIAGEDGSIEGFGTPRECEEAAFMATEALRRFQEKSAENYVLAALKAFVAKIDTACLVEHDHPQADLADELREALDAIARAEGTAP